MKKIIITLIVLVVIVIGAYYLFSNNPSRNTDTSPTPASTVTPPISTVAVGIKNFAFDPTVLTIKAGTKVIWTNNDSAPHTVTADMGNFLDSPTLSPGQSFSLTFNDPGTTNYHCGIHPAMKGVVIVQP